MSYFNDNYGRRPSFFESMPTVTKNLLIINVVMYLATVLIERKSGSDVMYRLFSLFAFESPLFKPWQIVTYMFMHGGLSHILFNMIALTSFGASLERMWGEKKFLLFFFVTGVGAALCHNLVLHFQIQHYESIGQLYQAIAIEKIPCVGASGAIYGLLMAYAVLFPDARIMLLIPPIPLKARWMAIAFIVGELAFGVTGLNGGVAHFAHLGGMLFGWLLMMYWKKKNRLYY